MEPTHYLEYLRIERFGSMSCRNVGPLSPHLNVVFGGNEAGKTTLATFVDGVMFGWEEARGNRNTYKPEGAERAGSLLFARRDGVDDPRELRRTRNADGVQGDEALLDDIDRDTYRTMFSLNSDELLALKGAQDMTARFLTAGAGAQTSPAGVLAELRARASVFTSRAASARESLVNLTARRDELRREVEEATREADRLRDEARELHDLEPVRAALGERMERVQSELDELAACRLEADKIDAELASLQEELDRLHDDERRVVADRSSRERAIGRRLANLSGAEDRALRERIDALVDSEVKAEHRLEAARDAHRAASATFSALEEASRSRSKTRFGSVHRMVQIGVSAALCALLICVGAPLFVQGRNAGSLSYAALGLVMVFFGLVLAAAALVLLFKPDSRDAQRLERLEAAREQMLQDEKAHASCAEEVARLRSESSRALEEMGLAAAGSLRRARVMLDEAKDVRADMALDRQRQQATSQRVDEIELRIAALTERRAGACARAGVAPDAASRDLDARIAELTTSRAEILERSEEVSRRRGELSQRLSQFRGENEFDLLKTRYHEVLAHIEDATRDFARLLLARRMLEDAVSSWEAQSQPEVFAEAGRLLALMTDGRWTGVRLADDGEVRIVDDARLEREPRHLSTATCQQLYLSLRIALLKCSDSVGRCVPVMADGILVHFDALRRRGAARALIELSGVRQVVLLTCHEEVVSALVEAGEEALLPVRVTRL